MSEGKYKRVITMLLAAVVLASCSVDSSGSSRSGEIQREILEVSADTAGLIINSAGATETARAAKPTEPMSAPLPLPTPTEIYLESDPSWKHESSYILRQERDGIYQYLAVYEPGATEGKRVLDGCLRAVSPVSEDRVAVIIGTVPLNSNCGSEMASDYVLYILDLKEPSTIRISSLYKAFGSISYERYLNEEPLRDSIVSIRGEIPAWSPNGRYLAFVGALDAQNSDLYLYDVETDALRRLSDGPNQATRPVWSLDGRGLFHVEARYASTYLYDHGLWWTSLDEDVAEWIGPEQWPGGNLIATPISRDHWLVWSYGIFSEDGPIYLINTADKSYEEIYGFVTSMSILQQGNETYLLVYGTTDTDSFRAFIPTLFRFQDGELINQTTITGLDGGWYAPEIVPLPAAQSFVMVIESKGLFASINLAGEWIQVGHESVNRFYYPSPDGKWLAVLLDPFGEGRGPLELYSVGDEGLEFTWQGDYDVFPDWAPDSSTLLIQCDDSESLTLLPSNDVVNVRAGCPLWKGWDYSYGWPWGDPVVVIPAN
ncbi:MAG: hypothetical protein U9N80_08275 [Chloroflexota bacterium]|nr:hypothetical protein [Chloroflexota bacterium]